MKVNVAVFFGGRSVEHEVSVISAMQAIAALDKEHYQAVPVYLTKDGRMYSGAKGFDSIESFRDVPALLKKGYPVTITRSGGDVLLARYPAKLFGSEEIPLHVGLPVMHGTNGEDGMIAGLCESVGLPYAGCAVIASALCMDKYATKAVLKQSGLPVLPGILAGSAAFVSDRRGLLDSIEKQMRYPLIIKPNNLGSSVGVSKADDRNQLSDALELVFRFTNRALVEPCLTNMREINCAVLGDHEGAEASVCERPFGGQDFLSYQDKYQSGGSKGGSKGMGSGGRELPADLPEQVSTEIRRLAVSAFHALDCAGVARVDCMIDDSPEDGTIYINELNTIPGSLSFYLWEASGTSFSELLTLLIKLALKRKRRGDSLVTTVASNILAGFKGSKGKLKK